MNDKRVWFVYTLATTAVIAALAFLSSTVIRLDKERLEARSKERLEERTRVALWRVDSKLSALLARESILSSVAAGGSGFGSSKPVGNEDLVERRFELSEHSAKWGDSEIPESPVPSMSKADVLSELTRVLPKAAEVSIANPFDSAMGGSTSSTDPFAHPMGGYLGGDPSMSNEEEPGFAGARKSEANPFGQEAAPISGMQSSPSQTREFQLRSEQVQNAFSNTSPMGGGFGAEMSGADKIGLPMSVWMKGKLLLARRIEHDDKEQIRGAVLDWPALRPTLLSELSDILPNADLVPAESGGATNGFHLASAPIRLVPGEVALEPGDSPVIPLLVFSWLAVLIAIAAFGAMLHQTTALGQRRWQFVSSVTHELRSPLTTFALYTEMLLDDMVADEGQRREYLTALSSESNRLQHLVENVLAYSRIEQAAATPKLSRLRLDEMLGLVEERLRRRAEQSGMELAVTMESPSAAVLSEANGLERIIFNLVDNACKYAVAGDPKRIDIDCREEGDRIAIRVVDHGPGIDANRRKTLFRPFSTSAHDAAEKRKPGVGLGLELSRRLARDMGGELSLENGEAAGTCFLLLLRKG